MGLAVQPLWADEVAPALGPNDHNPAYIARKTVEQIQVVAPILRLRLEPDLGSLVVGEADRGQLF
ncbi:MAG: hypothetical protein EBV35_09270, partial [Betaproteobacteria bacterium]|nr:hypothetical protein [Betaproteobacteria bacterium]